MRSPSGSDRQLINALKELLRHWEETSSSWRDQARAGFEKEYIQELVPVAHAALSAMGEINRLLQQAIHECS